MQKLIQKGLEGGDSPNKPRLWISSNVFMQKVMAAKVHQSLYPYGVAFGGICGPGNLLLATQGFKRF